MGLGSKQDDHATSKERVMNNYRISCVLMVPLLALCAAVACARPANLGTVDFPTSGSPQAQAHFLRGVAALHAFWYPVALDEFRAATRLEPDFMMGYWGEAMAHNHPLWGDPQATEAAHQVLKKIHPTPQLTPRERAYLHAVTVLYGPEEKPVRDRAYADAMEAIYREYPDDLEAAAFYALALLGTVVHSQEQTALRTRMRAAAIAMEVDRKAPNHPGAVHYIIHAFDDPDHAILALPAARRYADIAPAAPHALHMPSHIFLQLGMWAEAVASNQASWAASERWVQQHNLPISQRDYHSLHWLLYSLLQQGRYHDAEALLALMRQSLPAFPAEEQFMRLYGAFLHTSMAAAFVVDTARWDQATAVTAPLAAPAGNATAPPSSGVQSYQALTALAQTPALFARGLGAAMQGAPEAQQSLAEIRTIRAQLPDKEVFGMPMGKVLEVQALEIAAAASATHGDLDTAITTVQNAVTLEETMPPPQGPPLVIKPAHELLGEILLQAPRPADAVQQFATALYRHPNRARALLGAARAAAQRGERRQAVDAYTQLLQQWQPGDVPLPERQEAQTYLQQVGALQQAGTR
jgi:tetratricopeptide (TPR) repeat protein